MLTRLRLENFKAWRKADIAFGKITGFFGANSAGKSSLLQFLLLLKQTRNATDRGLVLDFGGPDDLTNLGTFADVVYRHDGSRKIGWQLDWSLADRLRIFDPASPRDCLFEGNRLQMKCSVSRQNGQLLAEKLAYGFGDVEFWMKPNSKRQFDLTAKGGNFDFLRTRGRPTPHPGPSKAYSFPDQVKAAYQNATFLSEFELAYENLMDSLYHLGPLRVYPRRQYHLGRANPTDVGPRGEFTMEALLAATRHGMTRRLRPKARGVRKKPFQQIIAHWLKELSLVDQFTLEEIAEGTNLYRAMVKNSGSSVATALTDVGFGVSQILPVLILLYYVPEGSTVLLEQPEIHLHPAVQSGLADIMLNVATVRNVQIVVESHSEHLMRRLQRRVAEEQAAADDVKLYFVSSQGHHAVASDLLLNEWGEIENWPKNFFGDEMGEISAIAKSALQRKIKRS